MTSSASPVESSSLLRTRTSVSVVEGFEREAEEGEEGERTGGLEGCSRVLGEGG